MAARYRWIHQYAVTDGDFRDVLADSSDDPRCVGAGYMRKWDLEAWDSSTDEQIEVIEGCGFDIEDDLSTFRPGVFDFAEGEDFRSSVFGVVDRLHKAVL
jgi:hypothetical protein